MEPVVRALDVGFGHTKFVSSVDGNEVKCAHFPSVAYPTESDETTDPMGGRRKTVGIPIDGLIYEVGPDVHLAADIFNAKQMHERYSETPEYLAMLRGALHYMKVERIDLLVVGLPVAAFKAKKRAALERLVLGRHDVGRGKTVQVERARVVPQPQGALMYYGHVHNRVAEIRKERSLIIDPGARTFDWLVTQGMQLVEKKSHSVNRGMFDVLQAIASGISKAIRATLAAERASACPACIRRENIPDVAADRADCTRRPRLPVEGRTALGRVQDKDACRGVLVRRDRAVGSATGY
jgi:plasmid segregation protein ParM